MDIDSADIVLCFDDIRFDDPVLPSSSIGQLRRKLTARSTTCPTGAPWKTSSARSLTRSGVRGHACGSRSGQSAERFG